MNAPAALSVVIATKDRRAFVARALESLAMQRDAPPFEAIVVDNGSSDDTSGLVLERATTTPFPLHLVRVPRPNRGAARNAGVARATGALLAFVDDDVLLPERFLASHVAAHRRARRTTVVSGPILNVSAYRERPRPSLAHYSGAFFCTCNVSLPRAAFDRVGGFDEGFDLYGWEDTELGLRLRRSGIAHAFAWDAYLWHVKPPDLETLDVVHRKTVERAKMAARLLRKDGGWRTRLATGAYAPNLWRSAVFAPRAALPTFRALALDGAKPAALRAFARAQYLDGAYAGALRAELARGGDAT